MKMFKIQIDEMKSGVQDDLETVLTQSEVCKFFCV